MAVATIKEMPFGYVVGGTDTDETTVFTTKKRIKLMTFAGNADNATCTVTSRDSGGLTYFTVHKFKSNDTNELNSASGNSQWFGERGVEFDGLKVKPSHADDRIYIFIA